GSGADDAAEQDKKRQVINEVFAVPQLGGVPTQVIKPKAHGGRHQKAVPTNCKRPYSNQNRIDVQYHPSAPTPLFAACRKEIVRPGSARILAALIYPKCRDILSHD